MTPNPIPVTTNLPEWISSAGLILYIILHRSGLLDRLPKPLNGIKKNGNGEKHNPSKEYHELNQKVDKINIDVQLMKSTQVEQNKKIDQSREVLFSVRDAVRDIANGYERRHPEDKICKVK